MPQRYNHSRGNDARILYGSVLVGALRTLHSLPEKTPSRQGLGTSIPESAGRLGRDAANKRRKILYDEKSFVFSIAVAGDTVSLGVNWYEPHEDVVQMTRLNTFDMRKERDFAAYKLMVSNILEWLVKTREEEIRRKIDGILLGTAEGR